MVVGAEMGAVFEAVTTESVGAAVSQWNLPNDRLTLVVMVGAILEGSIRTGRVVAASIQVALKLAQDDALTQDDASTAAVHFVKLGSVKCRLMWVVSTRVVWEWTAWSLLRVVAMLGLEYEKTGVGLRVVTSAGVGLKLLLESRSEVVGRG